jgi:hypothetical protein
MSEDENLVEPEEVEGAVLDIDEETFETEAPTVEVEEVTDLIDLSSELGDDISESDFLNDDEDNNY